MTLPASVTVCGVDLPHETPGRYYSWNPAPGVRLEVLRSPMSDQRWGACASVLTPEGTWITLEVQSRPTPERAAAALSDKLRTFVRAMVAALPPGVVA